MPINLRSSLNDQNHSKQNLHSHSYTSTHYQTVSRYSVRQPTLNSARNQSIQSNPTQAYGLLPYESDSKQNKKTSNRLLAPVKS
jgi:hypothetical protein